jgi:cytochrome bd-type quinol oxidase subunit 2
MSLEPHGQYSKHNFTILLVPFILHSVFIKLLLFIYIFASCLIRKEKESELRINILLLYPHSRIIQLLWKKVFGNYMAAYYHLNSSEKFKRQPICRLCVYVPAEHYCLD